MKTIKEKAEEFLKSEGYCERDIMPYDAALSLLTDFSETLQETNVRDHDILLKSSENGIYVNDQQRIGFQKGAKWMRDNPYLTTYPTL